MLGLGTIINVAAIAAGALVGIILKKGYLTVLKIQ